MTTDCPQDHLLAEYLDGVADESTATAVRAHLDACDTCADLVADSVSTARELVGRVGRYVVLSRVGSGGMGDVYAAYDPELDRKVAIKVHRAAGDDEQRVQQLIHEARSAARLNHPNVVRVYDAGRLDDGRAFVAMELIAGTTLRSRIEDGHTRSWRDVANALLLAGRGLAAAHAAGLVHSDFKPENVLVADDGRILVTDFGLARRGDDEATTIARGSPDGGAGSGPIGGTPGYMAPEQVAGRPADAASDQFAYAVTFHEALFGVRPSGGVRLPRPVPGWLRRVLRRGFADDPRDRYPELVALLRDIDRGLRRRALSITAGAMAAAAIAGWWVAQAQGSAAKCAGAGEPVAAVWNAERAGALRDGVLASGSPLREAASAQLERAIDDYADRVSSALVGACEATHVRHVQSPALLDRRSACFDRLLVDVDELVGAISVADADGLPRALEAVASLPPPSRCDAAALLEDDEVVTPARREALAPATRQLAKANALLATGGFDDARTLLAAGAPAASDRPAKALRAEWHLAAGKVLDQLEEETAARQELERAIWLAQEIDHGDVAVDAIHRLIGLLGHVEGAEDEAIRWANLGEAMIKRGHGDRDARSAIAMALGDFYAERSDTARAVASCERALTLVDPTNLLRSAYIMNTLGRSLHDNGRLLEAEVYLGQAVAQLEQTLGADHPAIATALLNLGPLQTDLGKDRDAVASLERARKISGRVYGEQHVNHAYVLINLGRAQWETEDKAAATENTRAALAILEPHADHRDKVAVVLMNLAGMLIYQKRADEALDPARRAVEILVATRGKDAVDTGLSRINLSEALQLSGQLDEALAQAEQAFAVVSAHMGADHPYRAQALARLGLAQLAAGRREAPSLADARTALERTGQHETLPEIERALASNPAVGKP